MLKHKINWTEFNLDKTLIICILRKDNEKTLMKLITINTTVLSNCRLTPPTRSRSASSRKISPSCPNKSAKIIEISDKLAQYIIKMSMTI